MILAAFKKDHTPVLTRSYNNGRTGANITANTFTPQLVAAKGLTRVKSLTIPDDPRVEAQPLYVPGLVINGKPHNVVLVASMGNHVFAFDADAPQGEDLLWTSTLLNKPYVPIVIHEASQGQHRETNVDLWGINILWGILSTPAVDLDKQQMYLVNWTEGSDPKNPVLLLHRIGLKDGKEIGTGQAIHGTLNDASGKPVIDASGRAVQLNPNQKQRAALLLSPLRGALRRRAYTCPVPAVCRMLCIERDSLRQEHLATFRNFRASIRDLVVLVDNSAPAADFNLAHIRIRAARGTCEVALATLEHHQAEHGC